MNFFTFFEIFQIFLDFFNFFLLTNLHDLLSFRKLPILLFSNPRDKIASQKAHFAPCSSLQGGRILSAALIYCLSFILQNESVQEKLLPVSRIWKAAGFCILQNYATTII